MPKKTSVINLLPQEEFQKSSWGRILHWATTSFRTIVIITELIVILAFLSRFWLDAKNADLNDTIQQNQTIIESYQEFEDEYRKVQQRIEIFSALSKKEPLEFFINKTVSLLPEDVRLLSVAQVEGSLQIKGVSASERSIVQYITNLANDPSFNDIKVTNAAASSEDQSLLVFTLEAKLTEQKGS